MKSTEQQIRDIQHFGEEGGVVPAVDVGATSTFLNPSDMERAFNGELAGCYLYSRHANPTVKALGSKLAAMEQTEAALGVASGMSAIHCAILQLMPQGGHLVSSASVYGGTYALFKNILPRMGVTVTFVDMNDMNAIETAIGNNTKVLYTETMSNPLLRIADLQGLSAIAKKRGLKLVVDNTFTPLIVTPAKFGADVVLHSCTKFISGASDLIGGAVCASQEFINSLIDINHGMVMLTGPIMDARIAHKLYTRLDHLGVRMIGHAKSAEFLAKAFEEEDVPVIYPGLSTHKDHARMGQIMNKEFGYGGMMTVDLGNSENALNLAHRLQEEKFGLYAVSLGFSRTLMSCPSISTSSEIPVAEQKTMGLSPGLLRLSIGYLGDDATMLKRFKRCYQEVTG
jgi:methionine-gamma-lyase